MECSTKNWAEGAEGGSRTEQVWTQAQEGRWNARKKWNEMGLDGMQKGVPKGEVLNE